MLGYGLRSWKRSRDAAAWPTCVGLIRECKLTTHSDSDGNTYGVDVKYEYAVGGKEFVGSTIAYGYANSSARQTHEKVLQKLQSAERVEVRYNPLQPEQSVLSYGTHQSIKFILAFGITWLAFTSGFSFLWWIGSGTDDILLNNMRML